MRDWEKKRSRGRGEIVFLGSKAILLPSTLVHSLHATLASGGMGVDCHWCHSPVNQSVTGSDGLHVAERKPPAKRHRGWSHHLFMLAIKPPLPGHSSSLAHWPYFTFWFWGNYSLLSWLSVINSKICQFGYDFLFKLLVQLDWQHYRYITKSIIFLHKRHSGMDGVCFLDISWYR